MVVSAAANFNIICSYIWIVLVLPVHFQGWAFLGSPGVMGVSVCTAGSLFAFNWAPVQVYPMAGGVLEVGLFLACAGAVCMGCFELLLWFLFVVPNRCCRAGVHSLPCFPWSHVLRL